MLSITCNFYNKIICKKMAYSKASGELIDLM